MTDTLPPVAAAVLVAAVDRLPARLRGKLDEAAGRAAGWPVTRDGDTYTVAVDEATTVTLTVAAGAVGTPDDVRCTCLLAPNCLHRAAVLARAPVHADTPEPPPAATGADPTAANSADPPAATAGDGRTATGAPDSGAGVADGTPTSGPAATGRDGSAPAAGEAPQELTPAQLVAVEHLWRAAVDVVAAGVTGSGVVARTALLRAAHDAQAAGVYRAAAAARGVASLLQAARDDEPQYRLADLTDTLRDLLGLVHQLRRTRDAGLVGAGRRRYDLQGSLRLYGICTTAVLADSGYAGVVTYLVDRDGTVWTTSDLAPGDAQRAAGAGNATVRLGESALTHRALTRAGLVVSGATGSADRQLGAGTSVRAVTASGVAWRDAPLAGLWAQPLAIQLHRAFGALALPVGDRPAGDDLLFLSVTVAGCDADAVHTVTDEGAPLALRVALDHRSFAYRENLRLLGRHPGLTMLLIGRPDPSRRATVYPLAVAPADPAGWPLPPALAGHVDLAFDRLHRTHLPSPDGAGPVDDTEPAAADDAPAAPEPVRAEPAAADPALHLLRRNVERVVSGGRSVLTFAGPRHHPSDARQLMRARLETGSAVLDRLTIAAVARPRDAFGRLSGDDGTAFAQAWLAAAAYTDAAYRAFAEASWLPGGPPPPDPR